jgi:putative transposase
MMVILKQVFESVLKSWDSQLIEFNGESDHVHLLSNMIANLKATSSKKQKWN